MKEKSNESFLRKLPESQHELKIERKFILLLNEKFSNFSNNLFSCFVFIVFAECFIKVIGLGMCHGAHGINARKFCCWSSWFLLCAFSRLLQHCRSWYRKICNIVIWYSRNFNFRCKNIVNVNKLFHSENLPEKSEEIIFRLNFFIVLI